MSTPSERIEALHREFGTAGSAMTVETFNARLAELLREERAPGTKAAAEPKAARSAPTSVTWAGLVEAMRPVLEEAGKKLRACDAKIAALEKRLAETVEAHNATVEAANRFERRLSRHAEHLAKLETRTRSLERGTGA